MEDHSTIVRALCERIRKLEDTVMKYKLRITELNCIVEGLDDGARYVVLPENSLAPTLTIAPDTSSDSSTVSSSLAPLASEPAVETKKAGRPLKDGVDEARRARRQKYYREAKAKKAITESKPAESSNA
jgi:hypothetical protein